MHLQIRATAPIIAKLPVRLNSYLVWSLSLVQTTVVLNPVPHSFSVHVVKPFSLCPADSSFRQKKQFGYPQLWQVHMVVCMPEAKSEKFTHAASGIYIQCVAIHYI